MTLTGWLSLVAVCVLGAMSPGPSLAVVVRHTVAHSGAHGFCVAVAHALGVGLYAIATALGLAALIAETGFVYRGLALAGAAYLLWLGASALRATGGGRFEAGAPATGASLKSAARDGLAIALLNPKIAVFFLALFSQFVRPGMGLAEVALLSVTATVIDGTWYALVALGLSGAAPGRWLRRHAAWIERATGALLVLLALTTAIRVLGLESP
ncbi:LysE family translocator [Spiribacter halobius]|uniref:Lysine transporter LysE n=1 Tax=Sediminicurvatus halobius TaxID=2182432 RepID=A0A2U2N1C5_9GAMM|nr:LysE family translocator [Spiribacter halobius]PWG62920.1 lysine transporter LysE [Spiribacter halobius]UEX77431.1 LysE family translocator [Spiribacter halobius]